MYVIMELQNMYIYMHMHMNYEVAIQFNYSYVYVCILFSFSRIVTEIIYWCKSICFQTIDGMYSNYI